MSALGFLLQNVIAQDVLAVAGKEERFFEVWLIEEACK